MWQGLWNCIIQVTLHHHHSEHNMTWRKQCIGSQFACCLCARLDIWWSWPTTQHNMPQQRFCEVLSLYVTVRPILLKYDRVYEWHHPSNIAPPPLWTQHDLEKTMHRVPICLLSLRSAGHLMVLANNPAWCNIQKKNSTLDQNTNKHWKTISSQADPYESIWNTATPKYSQPSSPHVCSINWTIQVATQLGIGLKLPPLLPQPHLWDNAIQRQVDITEILSFQWHFIPMTLQHKKTHYGLKETLHL